MASSSIRKLPKLSWTSKGWTVGAWLPRCVWSTADGSHGVNVRLIVSGLYWKTMILGITPTMSGSNWTRAPLAILGLRL